MKTKHCCKVCEGHYLSEELAKKAIETCCVCEGASDYFQSQKAEEGKTADMRKKN